MTIDVGEAVLPAAGPWTASVRARAADGLGRTAAWMTRRIDPVGEAGAMFETVAFLDSFQPSLMPRTSQHQGLAAGLHVLSARVLSRTLDAAQTAVVGAAATTPTRLVARTATWAAGVAAGRLPPDDDETLWRSGIRSGGRLLQAISISGAIFDVTRAARGTSSGLRRPLLAGLAITGGGLYWAARRLRHRQQVIPRWPVEQRADIGAATSTSLAVVSVGGALGGAFMLTRWGFEAYFGRGRGRTTLARAVNTGVWALGATVAYNAGIASIGRANEKIEPAYSDSPSSPLVSGSAESLSPFGELGLQGRRYVTDVIGPELIEEVVGEPAVAHPIRTYVGFNSIPLYSTGRAELALAELERTGAFDRGHLLLVSPTGTGWVDQTVVEAAEFLTRGDLATCSVQYGRFPSFLAVQKVGLGRIQFRLLLWGIRQRLLERSPERRPKVLIFGESLGAWTASDVLMSQGIGGFDHYGVDRALWVGLPALAKWSRNGMAAGANELVPEGTVAVFDRHEQLAALDDEARERLRAVILSHDNDPIAALRPELMIREPDWLATDERGRNIPADMTWSPMSTFLQVAIDAANAMVTVPGRFESFGHDYRGDTTRFVRDAFHLPPTTDAQTERIDDALKRIDVERKERLQLEWDDDEVGEGRVGAALPAVRFAAGVPLAAPRTGGAKWIRGRRSASPVG